MLHWLSMQTYNKGVVSSNLNLVIVKAQLVRKATVNLMKCASPSQTPNLSSNPTHFAIKMLLMKKKSGSHLIKCTSLEKLRPQLLVLIRSKSSMRRRKTDFIELQCFRPKLGEA